MSCMSPAGAVILELCSVQTNPRDQVRLQRKLKEKLLNSQIDSFVSVSGVFTGESFESPADLGSHFF